MILECYSPVHFSTMMGNNADFLFYSLKRKSVLISSHSPFIPEKCVSFVHSLRAVAETESRKAQMNVKDSGHTVETPSSAFSSSGIWFPKLKSSVLPELPFLPVSCDVKEAHLCTQVNNLPYKGYYALEALFKTVSRQWLRVSTWNAPVSCAS